ncbi:hypothetical protein JCM3765_000941 [Sporobolomyces pararoseus]
MKAKASTSSLQPPGSTTEARHQLRTRSPKGQRGRSRKSSNTPPPPPSVLRRIRNSPWFFPALVAFGALVLALLYSAIRISTHTADYYPPHSPLRPAKKSRVGRAGAQDPPFPAPPTDSKAGGDLEKAKAREQGLDKAKVGDLKKVKVGEQELDEAIRSALENTWHLSKSGAGGVESDPSGSNGGQDGGVDERSIKDERDAGKRKTLAELYEELDGLGISVDELNQVMQNAIGGNL